MNNQKDNHFQQNLQTEISKRDFVQTEETEMKELFSPFSDGILLNPSFASEEEMRRKARKRLRSRIRKFFASYYEITTSASVLRQRVIFLLSVFICSSFALENKNTEKLIPILFGASYFCLSYQIIENLIQWFYGKKTNSGSQKVECMFEIANKSLLALFVLGLNLQYYEAINKFFILLNPLLFLLELLIYLRPPLISVSQDKDYLNIVERAFYLLQSWMIAAKMNDIIELEWKLTLIFLWIYLGTHAVCVSLTGLLLALVGSASIMNLDTETLGLLKKKIIGYIWHICYYGFNIVGLVILIGIFQKIESNKGGMIETGLQYAKRLSIFLVIYGVVLFPILKKFRVSPFEDLRTTLQNQVISRAAASQKKYTLLKTENDDERKINFFLMISATYFSLLPDVSQPQFGETLDDVNISQDNLCYICENNGANAILTDCGHGGVCCECAIKSIEQKNECMECRKPARAIYKIENLHSRNGVEIIVQASELIQILEA